MGYPDNNISAASLFSQGSFSLYLGKFAGMSGACLSRSVSHSTSNCLGIRLVMLLTGGGVFGVASYLFLGYTLSFLSLFKRHVVVWGNPCIY